MIGPAGGGLLFDLWGYAAPFATSAAFSLAGVAFAARFVPETRWLGSASATAAPSAPRGGMSPAAVIASLPRPLYLLGAMLFLDFVLVFTFAFIEPPFVFYAYDTLDLTTVEFGAIISAYGLAMMLGQALFGRVADRVGPTPVVVAGCLLVSFFYWGLVFFTTFPPLVVTALIAGLGGALVEPALGAVYLQIAPEEHRSRVMGLKESAAALGAVMGPLLVAGAGRWLDAIGLFTVSALLLIGCALLAAIVLPSRGRFTAPVRKT